MRIAFRVLLVAMWAWPLVAWSQETVIVRPKEIDDVLVNPGIGFMTFQRFNGDTLNEGQKWTEGYPIEYQDFDGNLENEDYPMTSLAYFRVYWKFIEPAKGEYRWGDKILVTGADLRSWLPGDNLYDGAVMIPADTSEGQYDLDIGILEEQTDRPAVRLAIAGRREDGWYNLGTIRIQR